MERGRQRVKHLALPVAAAKQCGMAARRLDRTADIARGGVGFEPALRATPVNEPLTGNVHGRRGGRDRQPPERCRAIEERMALLAQVVPQSFSLFDDFAAKPGTRRLQRGSGARHPYI